MPRGDGTGPMGMGPMTGRAAGYCAGYGVPGFTNSVPGRGFGMGFGRGRGFGGGGRGWRHMFYATGLPGWMRAGSQAPVGAAPYAKPDPEAEREFLKDQSEALQAELDQVRKRMADLETKQG